MRVGVGATMGVPIAHGTLHIRALRLCREVGRAAQLGHTVSLLPPGPCHATTVVRSTPLEGWCVKWLALRVGWSPAPPRESGLALAHRQGEQSIGENIAVVAGCAVVGHM